MIEREPTYNEAREQAIIKALAALVTDITCLTPLEQMCRQQEGGEFLWTAAYHISNEDIDRAIDVEPREESVELELNYRREHLVGYWLLTGLNDWAGGQAFRVGGEEATAFALTLAEEYLAGGES